MYYQLTRNCNFNCEYCVKHDTKWTEYTTSGVYTPVCQFINKIAAENSEFEVNYYGGEPTLHPHFIDIAKLIQGDNIYHVLFSNMSADLDLYREFFSIHNHSELAASYHPKQIELYEVVNKLVTLYNEFDIKIILHCAIDSTNGLIDSVVDIFTVESTLKDVLADKFRLHLFPIISKDTKAQNIDCPQGDHMTLIKSMDISKEKDNINVNDCFRERSIIYPNGYMYLCAHAEHKFPILDVKTKNAAKLYNTYLERPLRCESLYCCYRGNRVVK